MSEFNKNSCISIITPSLNQGRFIEDTIISVLSQEGDFYLDYIIIDGSSTDNSVEIIKKYDRLIKEKQYPIRCKGIEYRWVSEPDRGQSDAINKGLRMAQGDILAWVNSDDKYVESAFSDIVEVFSSLDKPHLVYGNLNIINEKDIIIEHFQGSPYEGLYRLIGSCWDTSASFLIQPAVFFTKECIQECGLLDESLHALFDYDLFIRIATRYKLHYINKTLAEFRTHPGSKTEYMDVRYILERINVSRRYWRFLPEVQQEKMKIDQTRFLVRRLLLRIKQSFKDRDYLQLIRCFMHFSKEVIVILFDNTLRPKMIDSIRKYKLKCISR